MTRVAVVSTLAPNTPATGKSVMWGGLTRFLADRVGSDQFTYVFVGRHRPDSDAVEHAVRWVAQPSTREQLASLATSVAWGGRPFQEAAIAHARVARAIHEVLRDSGADLVLADTHRIGVMLRGPRTFRLVTYMDDLFSIRYERMLRTMREWPDEAFDPLGNFAAHLPRMAARLASLPAPQRWLLSSERRRVARTELEAPAVADLAVLINPEEAALLRARTGRDNIVTVPPAVPDQPRAARRPDAGRPSFVFLGAMNVPHNDMAVRAFLARSFRALLAERPAATLDVVGRQVSVELREAARPFGDSVRFHGFVEDLGPLMARATAVVAPLVFGSGVKIKVIEALARGVPVVATTVGAEGILVHEGDALGLAVVDDWSAFAKVCATLTSAELNARASAAARHLYDAGYAPRVVEAAYERLLV